MTNLRSLALFLLLLAPVFARGEQYLVVLKPGAAAEPDLKTLGAVEEHRWRDRVQVRVDASRVAELLAHPRVDYVQEMLAPGELARPTGEIAIAPLSGGTPGEWQSGTFAYDGVANIIAIGDDAFTYDSLGRVVRAGVRSGAATTTDVYAYDAFANLHRRTTTSPSGTSQAANPVSWATNRFTGASYDSAGNTLTNPGGSGTYGWDAMRMMSGLTAAGRNDIYVYTASDKRIASARNDGTWKWTFRDFSGRTIREMESSASSWLWIEDVVYRGKQLAGTERPAAQGGRRHFHNDHLGTARLITDHAGLGVSRHDYLPFGIELTSIRQEQERGVARENAYRFTGHERDFIGGTVTENTNSLDYMLARHYASTLGRFLTIDPGRDWNPSDPQSWNLYAYVQNNPISNVDTTGKWKTPIHDYLIEKAFPGLHYSQRNLLKLASSYVDRLPAGHFPGNSHEHGLRTRSETVQEAQAKSAAFYEKKIGEARNKLADSKATANNGTGYSEVMATAALWAVGEAMHMVTDMASPMHEGHQEWDPIFDPWYSAKTHPAGEKTIDPETEALLILQLQSIFGTVYGEEEQERAAGNGPHKTGKGN